MAHAVKKQRWPEMKWIDDLKRTLDFGSGSVANNLQNSIDLWKTDVLEGLINIIDRLSEERLFLLICVLR